MDIKNLDTEKLRELSKAISEEFKVRNAAGEFGIADALKDNSEDGDPRDIFRNLSPEDPAFEMKNRINQEHHQSLGAIQKEWDEHPERKDKFLEDIRRRNQEGVIEGFLSGWWEIDEDGNMSAPPKVFHLSDFAEVKNPTMAHVMAKAGIFPSVSQARKNGWDRPIETGEFTVTKKKIKIIVK